MVKYTEEQIIALTVSPPGQPEHHRPDPRPPSAWGVLLRGQRLSRPASWPVMNDYENIKNGFTDLAIPGLSQIPVLGQGLFDHNILVYLGVVIALVMWWYLSRSAPGLRLRAVGENPGQQTCGCECKAV